MFDWIPLSESHKLPDIVAVYVIRHRGSGKEYVGKSIILNNRMRQHRQANSSHYLHRAIRQHGLDQFEVLVVFTGSKEDVTAREIEEIAMRNTFAPAGYNMTAGGDGGNFVEWTPERRADAAKRATGRKASEETKIKRAASLKKTHADRRAKGIPYVINRTPEGERRWKELLARPRGPTPESRKRNISKALMGKPQPHNAGSGNPMYGFSRGRAPRARAVAVWEVNSMTPRIFDCVADTAEFYGVVSPQISVWAAGKTRPMSGRVFAYLD